MRNSRGLLEHEHLIKKHNLRTSSPDPDSLFWKMWNAGGNAIAKKTLETDFLKGIRDGDLDPVKYGAFNISDIYYCFSGAKDYAVAADRTNDPILSDYLTRKYASYDEYNKSACTTWSLNGPQSVAPTSVAFEYSEFERAVASGRAMAGKVKDPIYTLIVMLPCEFLWAWLAEKLAPPTSGNIYANWIDSNNSMSGAFAMGNYLQDYITKNPVDEKLANEIYLTAMEYEFKNFDLATN